MIRPVPVAMPRKSPVVVKFVIMVALIAVFLVSPAVGNPKADATLTVTAAPVATSGEEISRTASPTTIPASSDVPNDFMDLERDLTLCISSNPLPGCGREPTSPGDRGGWQQFLLFGIMMSGIGIIFWRVVRSIRARDRIAPSGEKVSP